MRPVHEGGDPALARALFASAFFIATSGLIYELVAGAMASYLLGSSVTQFSLVIGLYLSAMGVGSYLSRFVERGLLARFVEIEIAVAILGGFQATAMFAAFTYTGAFTLVLFGGIGLVGIGVGLELPLLMRILERHTSFKELVARVLFLDYIGALVASVAFPLVLLPRLGLLRTSMVFGIVNAGVALWATFVFEAAPAVRWRLRGMAGAAIAALVVGLVGAHALEEGIEADLFADSVIFREITPYQHIVVTRWDNDTRLFLDGNLQFSSVDEYRYHESLVHPAMASVAAPRRVLVLGGGDGLAVREVLRHDSVSEVLLIDLDAAMTGLFTDREALAALNGESLRDPRVTVLNRDAFGWLEEQAAAGAEPYDVVIVDFPDPNNYALGKLYTNHFYRLLRGVLAPGAAVAVQATSPLYAPEAYWCIIRTMEHEGLMVRPYHAFIPSFGEWGFALAGLGSAPVPGPLPEGLRFLDEPTLAGLFHFPVDMARRDGPINRLDNQALVRLYEEDWREIQRR